MSRSSTASSLHNFVCNYDTTQDLERIQDLQRKDIILLSYFLQINHGRVYCGRHISNQRLQPSTVVLKDVLTENWLIVASRSHSAASLWQMPPHWNSRGWCTQLNFLRLNFRPKIPNSKNSTASSPDMTQITILAERVIKSSAWYINVNANGKSWTFLIKC